MERDEFRPVRRGRRGRFRLIVVSIGFLGFGVEFPGTDWGDQLFNGAGNLNNGYWWLIYPVGVLLVLTVMAVNLIGDALRDALDVRLRRR